jgi:hypothetical protein
MRVALDRGHTLHLVYTRLYEAGVPISYAAVTLSAAESGEKAQELPPRPAPTSGRHTEPVTTSRAPKPEPIPIQQPTSGIE